MIQDRARVVIIGGGIAGASIAYHLAQLGWRDIVVLEQGQLVSGTTSHAPGLVGQLRSTVPLTRMLMYSVALYRGLAEDGAPAYAEVGSLRLASSKERLDELRLQAGFARSVGLEAQLLGPHEAARLFPIMSLDSVHGALYVPHDGSARPPVLARAIIREATARGVLFHPRTAVLRIEQAQGRVSAVETTAGRVQTDTLVVAAGIWSPAIGRMAGVPLPLVPMQHQYVITHPVPELSGRTLPNLRDPDKLVYMRQGYSLEAGPASAGEAMARAPIAAAEARITVGGYERNPRASSVSAIPSGANPTVLSFDPDHFAPLERAAIERVPALAAAGVEFGVNGLESFTPDGEFLLGPTNRLGGFWAACGFCAHGVSSAGGVGKLLAEWIVEGKPSLDLSAMSPDRFARKVIDEPWIAQEACRVYSTYYDIRSPIVGLP